jgi:hypothetical protein
MQHTTAFAPTEEDLEEGYFDAFVLTFAAPDLPEEEPEQGEP